MGHLEDSKQQEIRWRMSVPPVAASRWHTFPHDLMVDEPDRVLSKQLGWPEASLSVFRHAFSKGYGRADGWDARGPMSEAITQSARWYRRGVGAMTEGKEAPRLETSGHYLVEILQENHIPSAGFYVVDSHVATHWATVTSLNPRATLCLTEHTKTLDSVAAILRAWRASGSPQTWCIIGGGLLTDVAAFACALAGCTAVFVPTTLLAMADACVGGKTGVNFAPYGKNQIGAFFFPTQVLMWPGWLASLPERELLAGGGECLKHAFIAGDTGLAERLARHLKARDTHRLGTELAQVVAVKAKVVEQDPAETGIRAVLNFGHTLGHALEALSQETTAGAQTILHGEAVALGIAYAALLSERVVGLSATQVAFIWTQLAQAGCLMHGRDLATRLGVKLLLDAGVWTGLMRFVLTDKKRASGTRGQSSEWVLLKNLGEVARDEDGRYTVRVEEKILAETWLTFIQRLA